MSVLISPSDLAVRRGAAAGPLAAVAGSLASDLERLRGRELYVPHEKARLSRDGGRCARDGALLAFDPFTPHEHRCPRCGAVYHGEVHDRFWIYWYQLWLAERAVHGAVLGALGQCDWGIELASEILEAYVERYLEYPNVDNVLGPTRLFFSTYLESIWLLQICVAADLIRSTNAALVTRVRDRIVEPARRIIGEFDEGRSNRQVWNDVALLAAARLLGDDAAAERALFAPSGIVSHLADGLLPDGTWYEGENYHLFAHRGLWYGVTMAAVAGFEIPQALHRRFDRGFSTPFATALPDFTLPARRDSQFAISLRQWRIAEHCELGLARVDDPTLIGALYRMYCDPWPRADTGRATSSADVERNGPPTALSRADLSWRALLFARPELPPLTPMPPRSTLLEGQGIAVFRRDAGRAYVALDYGISGGGHGHPDRLNLLLAYGERRWLDDSGTGSYVDPSLHWYRSTLAHNAPLVDGHSQQPSDGWLLAYDERGAAGWIRSAAVDLATGTRLTRTLIVLPEYAIDILEWQGDRVVMLDLPVHADLSIVSLAEAARPDRLGGGAGLEDGFSFAHDASVQSIAPGRTVASRVTAADGEMLRAWTVSDHDVEWWRAVAPGAPGESERAFRILRTRAERGSHRTVFAWSPAVEQVEISEAIRVVVGDGSSHIHRPAEHGWSIELYAGSARSSIDLRASDDPAAPPARASAAEARSHHPPIVVRASPLAARIPLGEPHYRRSEQAWSDAGRPAAVVAISGRPAATQLVITVHASDLTFVPANAVNPDDNEMPEINGDGVQLYARTDRGLAGWMLVPDIDSDGVRIRVIEGGADSAISARWKRFGDGYEMTIELTGPPLRAVDVLINEMPRGRSRRRGQLVLSGASGEFVYLRGDRHDPTRLVPLRYPDD